MLLLFAVTTFAQTKDSLIYYYNLRTKTVRLTLKGKSEKNLLEGMTEIEFLAKAKKSRAVAIAKIPESQKSVFENLFISQVKEFYTITERSFVKEKVRIDKDIMVALVKHESAFRQLLTPDQLNSYRAYMINHRTKSSNDTLLNILFFNDIELNLFEEYLK